MKDYKLKSGNILRIVRDYFPSSPDESDEYIFLVDAYIHSMVRISLANTKQYPDRRWDVSTTGYILVKKDIEIIAGTQFIAPDTAKNTLKD